LEGPFPVEFFSGTGSEERASAESSKLHTCPWNLTRLAAVEVVEVSVVRIHVFLDCGKAAGNIN
jgi:hypothetical protein